MESAGISTQETKPVSVLKGHTNSIDHVDFSPTKGAAELLTGSHDMTLKVWDVAKGVPTATMKGHTYEFLLPSNELLCLKYILPQ